VNSEIQEHLPMVISEYWGDAAATQYLAQLQYGEEDRLIERLAGEGVDSDRYILFSSVNSTAEKETHGLLLEALKKQLPPVSAGGQGKPSVLVLLNISDFDERFANLAEYQDKLSAKVASWEKLIPEQVAVALWNPQKDSRKDFRDRLQSMNLAGEAQGV